MTTTQTEGPAVAMADIIEPVRQPLATSERPAQHAMQPQQQTTPSTLLQLAVQQGADLEKLERLMALQERWLATEAKQAFVAAMAAFKAEPMTIFKKKQVGYTTKDGDFVGYTHARLSDVTEVVIPAMGRHGLSHRWDIRQESGRVHVSCVVTHRLGHSESVAMDCPPDTSGKKNPLQQIASATSYLQRYTLLAVTGMATTDMDDDGAGSGDADDDDDKSHRGAARTTPLAPKPPAEKPYYTDEEFAEREMGWAEKITDAEKPADPDRLMAFVETKGKRFTEAQREKLRGYKAPF